MNSIRQVRFHHDTGTIKIEYANGTIRRHQWNTLPRTAQYFCIKARKYVPNLDLTIFFDDRYYNYPTQDNICGEA